MHRIQINYASNKPNNSQSAQEKKEKHDENEIKVIEPYIDSLSFFLFNWWRLDVEGYFIR